jgi:hypothetical protein
VTLFASASTYAPGEPGDQGLPPSQFQNMDVLGRWRGDLDRLGSTNVVVGMVGLLVLAFLWHRYHKAGK